VILIRGEERIIEKEEKNKLRKKWNLIVLIILYLIEKQSYESIDNSFFLPSSK
jgi:hypothetical protein